MTLSQIDQARLARLEAIIRTLPEGERFAAEKMIEMVKELGDQALLASIDSFEAAEVGDNQRVKELYEKADLERRSFKKRVAKAFFDQISQLSDEEARSLADTLEQGSLLALAPVLVRVAEDITRIKEEIEGEILAERFDRELAALPNVDQLCADADAILKQHAPTADLPDNEEIPAQPATDPLATVPKDSCPSDQFYSIDSTE